MDILVPLLETPAEIPAAKTLEAEESDNSTKTHYEMLLEQELRIQREDENYAKYIGILSKEGGSNTD